MITPSAPDGGPFATGIPQPVHPGTRARVAVGAVALTAAVVALIYLLLHRTPVDGGFEAGDEFTCSDGTFTLTLPDGWIDYTDEYRTAYREDNGVESGIEGFISIDGLPYFASSDFVTMSGHPLLAIGTSSSDLHEESVSYWIGRFDNLESSIADESTTDAGDEILYTTLRGTGDGREWQVILVTVTGEDTYAKFILESRRGHEEAESALLGSAKTLVFNPIDTTYSIDPGWYLPHDDGRTYSSEGGASVVIPESWTYIGQMWDSDALNPTINFDFLGLWRIGGAEDDGPFDIRSVSMQVSLNGYPDLTAVEQLTAQFGAVGETTTDSAGVRYTVEAIDPWTVPGAEDSARVRLVADYEATGEPFFEGRIVDRIGYLLIHGRDKLVAFLEFPGSLDEAILTSFEETLETVEFRP